MDVTNFELGMKQKLENKGRTGVRRCQCLVQMNHDMGEHAA